MSSKSQASKAFSPRSSAKSNSKRASSSSFFETSRPSSLHPASAAPQSPPMIHIHIYSLHPQYLIDQFCKKYQYFMIKHRNRNSLNSAYFKREDQPNLHYLTSPLLNHRYTLLGIAKINTNGFDIYNNYFLSPYRQEYLQLQNKPKKFQLKESHVSRFFITFVKILAIKYLIQPHAKMTAMIDYFLMSLFTDIFEEKYDNKKEQCVSEEEKRQRQKRKEEVRLLCDYLKPSITMFFHQKEKEMETTYEQQVKHVQVVIKKQISSILTEIERKYEEIVESQVLPDNMTSIAQIQRYIHQNYKKIDSIDSLNPLNRKYVYESFITTNRPFLKIEVPYFIDTFSHKENSIILPKYSDESEPVLSKLVDYVPRIHKANYGMQQLSLIICEKMKQLVGFFRHYQRKTSRMYPTTNLKDIYYDQKSMKIVVSYHPLIHDVLGMKDSSKSAELRLATEPTPSFNFHTCHLQLNDTISSKLRKKYYYPKQIKNFNQQDQSSEKKAQDSLQYEENIQVWRIINKLYFMSRNANMVNDLYEMYYCRMYGEQKGHIPRPFRLEKYKEITEQIYEDISANPEMLMHLIPQLTINSSTTKKLPQPNLKTKQQQLSQLKHFICLKPSQHPISSFHFTLSELSNHFHQEDDDSLFQTLKLSSFISELYYRLTLIKEINLIFDSKLIFKRMLNVKKYLIMYFVSIMEKAYLMASVRRLEQRKANAREEVQNQLQKGFKNVYFNSQFERRRNGLQLSIAKIKGYMDRKDYNSEFLKKNQHYYDDLFIVYRDMKMIAFQEDVCRLLERNTSKSLEADVDVLMKKQEVQMSQQEKQPFDMLYSTIRRQIERISDFQELKATLQTRVMNRINEMHEKALSSLKKLTLKDVQPYVQTAQIFHKAIDLPSKAAEQVCLFYNFKLLTMLKMYLTSNNNNWRYQRMYNNSLIGGKVITLRSPLQQIRQLDKEDLEVLVRKMRMIIKTIGQHK